MGKSTKDEREQFHVGDWVRVDGVADQRTDESGRRYYKPMRCVKPRIGQVVGATRLMTGTRYAGWLDRNDYEPPGFTADGSVLVWLVRCGVTSKPIACFAEQLTPCEPLEQLPWRR